MLDLPVCYLLEPSLRNAGCETFSLCIAFTEIHSILGIFVVEAILDESLDAEHCCGI